MSATQTYTETLVVVRCNADGCDVTFAMTEHYYQERCADHRTWYCPNGHRRCFNGPSEEQKQRKRAERAEQETEWAKRRAARIQAERRAAEYTARAYKGHVTRLRNRIAAGVCPVGSCRRNFVNVKAHIESQHPEWAHDHPEALT